MIVSPCPFCGSHQIHVEQWSDMVTVSCLDCLAVGPVTAEQSQAEAWERWNRRARFVPSKTFREGVAGAR